VKIGRFEPTSQVCSTCGAKDGPKPLKVREWTCATCGTVHDRDVNAAQNVKTAAGLAASACGAQVRPGAIPAQREETGSHGIPSSDRAAKLTATGRDGRNPHP
jgi:putative transposase